mmetsp:Transcript_23774/g.70789  ORF Transcript_23774/g.70789 Transcript_23774/m.70789 type:complete len:258 (+) Transcript_23774:177-950(+)
MVEQGLLVRLRHVVALPEDALLLPAHPEEQQGGEQEEGHGGIRQLPGQSTGPAEVHDHHAARARDEEGQGEEEELDGHVTHRDDVRVQVVRLGYLEAGRPRRQQPVGHEHLLHHDDHGREVRQEDEHHDDEAGVLNPPERLVDVDVLLQGEHGGLRQVDHDHRHDGDGLERRQPLRDDAVAHETRVVDAVHRLRSREDGEDGRDLLALGGRRQDLLHALGGGRRASARLVHRAVDLSHLAAAASPAGRARTAYFGVP